MCLGPVRAVLSLCEKNHSFPRVEDERVFRLQTPVGLCGLDCLSLFPPPPCHLFLKKKKEREREREGEEKKRKKKQLRLWHRLSGDGGDMARSWTISLIKTLSFCIIDLARAAIGGSSLSVCACVCVCVCVKA